MNSLLMDLRFAARSLIKSPGFTVIVVLTLGLGIGANAAVFSVMDALIWHPFPIPGIDRLVAVWEVQPAKGLDESSVAPANFLDWKGQDVIEDLHASAWWDVNMTGQDYPERLQGSLVTPGWLELLQVDLLSGTALRSGPEHEKTVVISHRLWSQRFGGDPDIVGRTLILNGAQYEVVGVAQSDFAFPFGADLWAPLIFDPEDRQDRTRGYLRVYGRLAENKTIEDANAALSVISTRLSNEYPETNTGIEAKVESMKAAIIDQGVPNIIVVWQGSVIMVLLLACVNVACLLLVRGADRRRELSLRAALGATRGRVVKQLLTENLLLSFGGAFVALPLAWGGVYLMRNGLPAEIRRFVVGWDQIDVDLRVVVFTACVAVITTVIFGLVPALSTSRLNLNEALGEGGRNPSAGARQKGRSMLVGVEVALAMALLVVAGLCVQGTIRMFNANQGYNPESLLTMELTLPEKAYGTEEEQRQFYRTAVEKIESLPGVESVGITNILPSGNNNWTRSFMIEEQPVDRKVDWPMADFRSVSADYFDTMEIPLIKGRGIDPSDNNNSMPVAVISRFMAERYWEKKDPIGAQIRLDMFESQPTVTVVGIAEDVLHDWFLGRDRSCIYVPLEQFPVRYSYITVRTSSDPVKFTPAIRDAISSIDRHQPIYNVRSMGKVLSDRMIGITYVGVAMAVFGAIALVLAVVGIYGIMAYSVSRRTQEIGLRMALGAGRGEILKLTLGGAAGITIAGIAVGLVLAWLAGRFLEANLFGIVKLNLIPFVQYSLVLAGAALIAAWFPARRAVKVQPADALRRE